MSNIFWLAKQVMHQRGFNKGDFVDPDDPENGPVCALGAINVILSGDPRVRHPRAADDSEVPALNRSIYEKAQDPSWYDEISALFTEVSNELYPRNGRDVVKCLICDKVHGGDPNLWENVAVFNDASDITKEMVMHVFSHAAAQLDALEAEEESGE